MALLLCFCRSFFCFFLFVLLLCEGLLLAVLVSERLLVGKSDVGGAVDVRINQECTVLGNGEKELIFNASKAF